MTAFLFLAIACTSSGSPDPNAEPGIDTGASAIDDPSDATPSDTGPADDTGTAIPGEPSAPECAAPGLRLVSEFTSTQIHPMGSPPAPFVLGSCGWGLAVLDVNDDGWPDLVPAGAWAQTHVLVNDGGSFAPDSTIEFDGGPLPMGNGLTTGDVDGDGRVDLVLLTSTGTPDRVYINRGEGRFESTELVNSSFESQSAALFDADADGDLDLFVARHVDAHSTSLPELMAGTFEADPNGFYWNDAGVFSPGTVPGNPVAASFQGIPYDADDDGDLDLLVINDFGAFIHASELMVNEGGTFTTADDCQCDGAKFGMGGAVGDVDGDGVPDVHVTNFGSPELLMGMGDGRYYESALARGIAVGPERVTGWGTSFIDLNMDGHSDLVSTFGPVLVGMEGDWSDLVDHEVVADIDDLPAQPNALWMNDGDAFTEFSSMLGFDAMGVTRAVVVADFNRDGLPDLATSGLLANRHQVIRIYASEGGCGPGVVVDFPEMGAADLGATVEWSVNGLARETWMLPGTTFSNSGSSLHLGLAGHPVADWVRITPVNGDPVEHANVPAGTTVTQRSYQ